MIPGCTNALDIVLDDQTIDLNNADDIIVTINQNGEELNFTGDRVFVDENGYSLSVYLTQQESLKFRYGPANATINWVYEDLTGEYQRASTDPFTIYVGQQLYRKVMT
jgi:hypothetical protein